MTARLPLEGVTVVDLSRALAGPYYSALLADLGATIVKVESSKGGDVTRLWPPFEGEHSLYFESTNRNKSSIALDFYSEQGRAVLHRLVGQADVLLENFRPGVMDKLGLDSARLSTAPVDEYHRQPVTDHRRGFPVDVHGAEYAGAAVRQRFWLGSPQKKPRREVTGRRSSGTEATAGRCYSPVSADAPPASFLVLGSTSLLGSGLLW